MLGWDENQTKPNPTARAHHEFSLGCLEIHTALRWQAFALSSVIIYREPARVDEGEPEVTRRGGSSGSVHSG